MATEKIARGFALLACLAFAIAPSGCDRSPAGQATSSQAEDSDGHDHSHGEGHGHSHGEEAGEAHGEGEGHSHGEGEGHDHGHGPARALGQATQDGLEVRASVEGDVKAGTEASFDVQVAPSAVSVRAWIGSQDGKGAIRAKAEREGTGWHVHVEVPSPIPAKARLWLEIERAGGARSVVGFDLPAQE